MRYERYTNVQWMLKTDQHGPLSTRVKQQCVQPCVAEWIVQTKRNERWRFRPSLFHIHSL